jgi:histidine triad (HIT) family protein
MTECLFCRIAAKTIPAKIVYEDDLILAFDDIRPQAPVHTLIIPKEHFASLNEVPADRSGLLSHILLKAREIAAGKGVGTGQEVFHIHLHVLGGRPMHWPPG